MTTLFRAQHLNPANRISGNQYLLWASELSPFALKIESILLFLKQPYRFLPAEGTPWQNRRVLARIELAKKLHTVKRYPYSDPLDEYPLVPYLLVDNKHLNFDSTGIAQWFDARKTESQPGLYGKGNDGALEFVALLIEEAFDEFGLYIVHHNRWVHAVACNNAGKRLAREFSQVIPSWLTPGMATRFSARQIRRLPYLFSVSAEPENSDKDSRPASSAPHRAGFPPTHALLDKAFDNYLAGLETVLAQQPYLLGNTFTVADAAVYGQLGMNLSDPRAEKMIAHKAPLTHQWLYRIAQGEHRYCPQPADYWLSDHLRDLLATLSDTFVALMQQNKAAYQTCNPADTAGCNENGFDNNQGLYTGQLMGYPFKTVVKTFQLRVFNDLRQRWQSLSCEEKERVASLMPDTDPFEEP